MSENSTATRTIPNLTLARRVDALQAAGRTRRENNRTTNLTKGTQNKQKQLCFFIAGWGTPTSLVGVELANNASGAL